MHEEFLISCALVFCHEEQYRISILSFLPLLVVDGFFSTRRVLECFLLDCNSDNTHIVIPSVYAVTL